LKTPNKSVGCAAMRSTALVLALLLAAPAVAAQKSRRAAVRVQLSPWTHVVVNGSELQMRSPKPATKNGARLNQCGANDCI
jgi:hypothetical protein